MDAETERQFGDIGGQGLQAPNLTPPLDQLERRHRRTVRRIAELDRNVEAHAQAAQDALRRQDYSAAATEAHRALQYQRQADVLRELMLP
jgi:hypothetical protein